MTFLFGEFVKRLMPDRSDGYIESVIDGNPTVLSVELALRRISWLFLGANHWSVILALSNGQWVCIQFHPSGAVTGDVFNCERDAALHTCPRANHSVRMSNYGITNRTIYWSDIVNWVKSEQGGHYILFMRDCQTVSRKLIGWLTGKWVGVWPFESGKIFHPEMIQNTNKCNYTRIQMFIKITFQQMKMLYKCEITILLLLYMFSSHYIFLTLKICTISNV